MPILMGGPTRRIKDSCGRIWTFEMHPQCGPVALDSRGDPAMKQPGERSDFWRAASLWAQQGQKIDADGLCAWTNEPEPILEHIGGRHYRVIGRRTITQG